MDPDKVEHTVTYSFSSWIRFSVSSVASSSAARAVLVCGASSISPLLQPGQRGRPTAMEMVVKETHRRGELILVSERDEPDERKVGLAGVSKVSMARPESIEMDRFALVPILVGRLVQLGLRS